MNVVQQLSADTFEMHMISYIKKLPIRSGLCCGESILMMITKKIVRGLTNCYGFRFLALGFHSGNSAPKT